jgi:phosphomannomutase
LARLAAFYPKCRDCPHRGETGQIMPQIVERLQESVRRVEHKSLFGAEGVRGVYLNELDHTKAGQIAGALASLLWDEVPLVARPEAYLTGRRHKRTGPVVVIGHDERPSSPDIVTGIAKTLRRMGCHVIDVSLVTRPCFWFAADHLQAAAAIHVTGSGKPPAWTGLDFVGAGVIPFSRDYRLSEIEQRLEAGFSRPLRQSAGQRTFHASALYEAGLWKHFHALRPLRVCVGCPNRLVRDILQRLFGKLACKLIPVSIPVRARHLADPEDADSLRLSQAVRQAGAHLGLLIDDDGQACAFFDERGQLVPAGSLTRILAGLILTELPGSSIVVEEQAAAEVCPAIEAAGGKCVAAAPTLTSLMQTLRRTEAPFGGGDSGRYWFREAFPTCDAILTLAKVLQALSRSDADFSEVANSARLESRL